ncbi:maltose alpha-D-glucosyltransferase [Acidicapsa ligni]|uniref:maltose alpha-D-glucosyltransferase n=1 Tax=Acidicapsa ligni TaxID=542300 RepID=UPI0021DFBD1A|nr:maltose alpha-D-glucosyltransferase [Acidicapsa ligni]
MKKLASATDPLWYKDAIIYELHVRAFADSNGDGIGDFPGLLSRLDYLQDLGVTCIWLLPFFPSPLRDDGYDIANYVDVNPSYGTLNDFKAFLDAAHQRNMQVMIELVINHTSDQHPWFKASRLAAPGSAAREMYVWSDSDQVYKDARIIFTDTEKSNWTWDETAKAYYWHRFFSHQPDLNFDNPAVIEEVLKAMRFWLDMGVDALRMDAIPYLVERDGTSCENLPETHAAIKAIRTAIDADYANRLILAEANQWPADVRPYFGDGDECHMAFHFPLMPRIYMALRQEDRLPITDIMAQTPAIPDNCQWGLFLRNHDELTLEMVTDDERDYMYFAYSADPRMRINVGIRRRLAPLVDNNRRRIELLNSLLLSFPGTPIMYYGDELGMGDNIYLGDRNGVRTPMQWNSDRNAGFSKCDPARLYFPVVMDPIYGYQVINVEAQLSDQSSLLHWTRNMIALRKLFQVFGRGTLTFLNPANRKILAYLRDLDRGDGSHETVLCVANLSRFAQPVSLDLATHAGLEPVEMLGYVPFPTITEAPYALSLAPYSFLWLELQPASAKVDSALSSPEDAELANVADILGVTASMAADALDLMTLGWTGLISNAGSLLENALRAWLPRQRWFGAKTRTIQALNVLDWAEIPLDAGNSSSADTLAGSGIPTALVFIEITYADGVSETYQLPLAISTGTRAEEFAVSNPQSILATITSQAGPAILYDATSREDLRLRLLTLIERNEPLALSTLRIPSSDETGLSDASNIADAPASSVAVPVVPAPLDAQPGEAASSPHSERLNVHSAGKLQAYASSAFSALHLTHPTSSRVGSAEQSNTSILYGKDLILKLFRRLQPGENPDVEIGRFLTEIAHFPRIAPFFGEIDITPIGGEKTTVAMLQGLVANEGDGWQWFLDELKNYFASVASLPAPPAATPASFLIDRELPREAFEHARASLEAAALLGRRTAEMHLALATPTHDPAFAAEPITAADLNNDARRIDAQITSTLEALKSKLSTLKDLTADNAGLLLSRRINLFSRAHAITSSAPGGLRIRIHGDYHLGQTLRTAAPVGSATDAGDFVLLDFEGEPARPLSERRQKQSPLKDVAGMLRSFSYAAHSGLNQHLAANPESSRSSGTEALSAWEILWQDSASTEFLQAYRKGIAANPSILPSPQQSQALLSAYLLEKALYELLYELNNRPEWLRIPLSGILALES